MKHRQTSYYYEESKEGMDLLQSSFRVESVERSEVGFTCYGGNHLATTNPMLISSREASKPTRYNSFDQIGKLFLPNFK